MHDIMSGHVARGAAPGVVTVLSRHGEVRVDAIGRKAIDGDEPMRRDTIFRITSMTKGLRPQAGDGRDLPVAREGRFDHLFGESTGTSEPLPLEPRLGPKPKGRREER